jgi:hypothetical protein
VIDGRVDLCIQKFSCEGMAGERRLQHSTVDSIQVGVVSLCLKSRKALWFIV